MAPNTLISDFSGVAENSQPAKGTDTLPLPSTTPASQSMEDHRGMGHTLFWLLQYLNPLFYARLAQALVGSVLESYKADSENKLNARIAEHPHGDTSAPIPADATVIECEYSHRNHNPLFESLPQLDLEYTSSAIPEDCITNQHSLEVQNAAESVPVYHAHHEENSRDTNEEITESDKTLTTTAATTIAKDNDTFKRKNGKKSKRGKGKNN
ncbi:hypothetical protein GGH14_005025 [Coemansia sp. RSA 370]|nr:hypothetical protein GGH14_005025 [Coemansia sp. RSA 370]